MLIDHAESYWDLVESAACAQPDRPLLSDDYGRVLSAAGLRDAALRYAAVLSRNGAGRGTVVSWQLPTTLETMVIMVALTRLGAVQNPIIPTWRESELRHAITQIGTELFICPHRWHGYGHFEAVRTLGSTRSMKIVPVDLETPPHGDALRLPRGEIVDLGAPVGDRRRTSWVYYSSGTTSAPKGIRHSDASVLAGAAGIVEMIGTDSSDVNPIAFPVSHIGGAATLAAALVTKMRLVLFDEFDPVETPVAMASHDPTLLGSATPFFMAYLSAQRRAGGRPLFPRLRGCTGGGAPITPELGRRVRTELGVAGIANAWGLTEFPVATSAPLDAPAEILDHTVGKPLAGVQIRIVDALGRESASDDVGELRLKGPQCFLGYSDPALDAVAFDSDGWFCTGDLGSVDQNGYVRVTGRIKDAIIRNAENVSALEVEEVLAKCAGVADVAVIGVPDEVTGERVCAVVVPAPGVMVDLAVLADHCRAHGLSRYKNPERIEFVDALPRNPTGKVLKTALRERFR
ncbi:MAG: class I adenylate-forming enzyme family protein [Mycobacterium sp.]|nr:class I adenylate-forming enzyme family protein [Mycobacterium sp.]